MRSKENSSVPGGSDWHQQRKQTVHLPGELPGSFSLYPEEEQFFTRSSVQPAGQTLGFAVTPYYLSLAGTGYNDPVRRQCIPSICEYKTLPYENDDPLSDVSFSPVERLVHRYRDRALILVTDECAVYCRHCFRRHFSSRRNGALSTAELNACVGYINSRPEIHEVILSGGDPLTLEDDKLLHIIRVLREGVERPLVFRLASRTPVVMPQRITSKLIDGLKGSGAIFLLTQFNHRKEITPESSAAVLDLVNAGIPVLNQAVLLRGINDSVEALADLFQGLLEIKVKPYYLFQGDLASGTSHFRVSLERGMKLYKELRRTVSGMALPVYAVDLPQGGGKIPLTENYLEALIDDGEGKRYRFTGPDGQRYYYPHEPR